LGFDMRKPPVSTQISDAYAVGLMLFRYFNLPFQIVGILLLVATVGVVLLSKRELK
jgi:NADH-quinone oxidoreductase subunit J